MGENMGYEVKYRDKYYFIFIREGGLGVIVFDDFLVNCFYKFFNVWGDFVCGEKYLLLFII